MQQGRANKIDNYVWCGHQVFNSCGCKHWHLNGRISNPCKFKYISHGEAVRDHSSLMTHVMTKLDRFIVYVHIQHTFDSKVHYAVEVMSTRKTE